MKVRAFVAHPYRLRRRVKMIRIGRHTFFRGGCEKRWPERHRTIRTACPRRRGHPPGLAGRKEAVIHYWWLPWIVYLRGR